MDSVFSVRDVAFSYDGRPVLRRVSFAVRPGTLVCLLGQNGCGKTTLLRLLLGLLAPDAGALFGIISAVNEDPSRRIAVTSIKRCRTGLSPVAK